jgi:hypothetical protein
VLLVACAHAPASVATPVEAPVTLVMLSTESDSFPTVATAATGALAHARVAGVTRTVTKTVSIEVVQLSIECVDATAACYGSAARSLSAGKLLFAQIDGEHAKPRVTITLFDATTNVPKASQRTFASEAAAVAGVDNLVAEVTR